MKWLVIAAILAIVGLFALFPAVMGLLLALLLFAAIALGGIFVIGAGLGGIGRS